MGQRTKRSKEIIKEKNIFLTVWNISVDRRRRISTLAWLPGEKSSQAFCSFYGRQIDLLRDRQNSKIFMGFNVSLKKLASRSILLFCISTKERGRKKFLPLFFSTPWILSMRHASFPYICRYISIYSVIPLDNLWLIRIVLRVS